MVTQTVQLRVEGVRFLDSKDIAANATQRVWAKIL